MNQVSKTKLIGVLLIVVVSIIMAIFAFWATFNIPFNITVLIETPTEEQEQFLLKGDADLKFSDVKLNKHGVLASLSAKYYHMVEHASVYKQLNAWLSKGNMQFIKVNNWEE